MILKRDYPYMYARVSAKKAKLLEKNDYENLLKMQPNEIARNLEERDYKKEINDLGAQHDGVELVELALMRNLSRTMTELVEISPESLKPVINTYLRRYDLLSLKRLLRWKKGGEVNNIESFMVPVGRYSIDELKELSEKSFEEICESISFPESDMDYQSCVKGETDLKKIERNLDRMYYTEVQRMSKGVGSKWFDKFMSEEITYENLKIALRLKKYGLSEEEIREWLVSQETDSIVDEVLRAENIDEALEIVKGSELTDGLTQDENIEEVEHALEVARLQSAVKSLHVEPLSATSILGYVVAKLIEVKNLRMLIRAKETGIQNLETIRANLVIS